MSAAKIKKVPLQVRVDEGDVAAVNELASDYRNLSVNEVAALALGELAKVPRAPGALWEALGRIAGPNGRTPAPAEPHAPRHTRTRIAKEAISAA